MSWSLTTQVKITFSLSVFEHENASAILNWLCTLFQWIIIFNCQVNKFIACLQNFGRKVVIWTATVKILNVVSKDVLFLKLFTTFDVGHVVIQIHFYKLFCSLGKQEESLWDDNIVLLLLKVFECILPLFRNWCGCVLFFYFFSYLMQTKNYRVDIHLLHTAYDILICLCCFFFFQQVSFRWRNRNLHKFIRKSQYEWHYPSCT